MKGPVRFRVLYAEDDQDAREMVTTMFEFVNIEVSAVGTVAEAWHLAQTEDFDLYLLDCRFPEESGLDLCRLLREYARQTPIVFYSAAAFQSDLQDGLSAGANAYLTKPYLGNLNETILQIIELSKKCVVGSCEKHFMEAQQSHQSDCVG
jgi:CheY-like chemotaxis protein